MTKPLSRAAVRIMVKQVLALELIQAVAKLWTIQDVLNHLQITERTFYRNRAKWKFPVADVREGAFIRWLPETVKTWESKNRVKKTSPQS